MIVKIFNTIGPRKYLISIFHDVFKPTVNCTLQLGGGAFINQ